MLGSGGQVAGARQLERLMRLLPEEITADVKVALRQAAEICQAEVVARVPVLKHPDKRRIVGQLRAVLAAPIAIGATAKGLRVTFGFRTKRMRKLAFYAHFVEFGTKGYSSGWGRKRADTPSTKRKQRIMRSVPPHPAQPFMRPGFHAAQPKMRAIIDQAVVRAMDRAAARYGTGPKLIGPR